MRNEHRENLEIDLQKLLLAYLRKWWLIVAAAVVAGLLTLYVTANFITPMYEAEVTVYVNNIRSDQKVEYVSSSDLATSQRLVNTYIAILESNTVLEKVVEESGLDVTVEEILKAMESEQVNDTEVFTVTITLPDPEMAARLANTLAEVAPGEIGDIVEGSSTKIIDYAKVPDLPASPSKGRSTVLGFLVGAVLAALYVTLRFLLDVRIKDEEDLTVLFNLPVLSQIPTFVPDGTKRKGSYGYGGETTSGHNKNWKGGGAE